MSRVARRALLGAAVAAGAYAAAAWFRLLPGREAAGDAYRKFADRRERAARLKAKLAQWAPENAASPAGTVVFLGSSTIERGNFAVYAYPRQDVWSPEHRVAFINAMRAIDPRVTGMPILGDFMVARTHRALRITAILGGCLLFACVLAGFPRILPALVAMVPTFLTIAGLHAVMKVLGIPFNPINLMALPVIMGIGVDDGVYIVHRYLFERGDVEKTLAVTGRSVVLTSLTTIAAFGSLAFTSHRGLASFAMTLCLGVGIALVLSVTVLPLLLKLSKRRLIPS